MEYYVYILYSKKVDKYYVGYCADLESRLSRHNAGATPSTKNGRPWILVYHEEFNNKTDTIKRERQIKKMKSRQYIEKLIKGNC